MAIISITQQPYWNQMFSAYRPIEYIVRGDANQWVYCDVYINGTFYKTLMTNVRHAYGPGTSWYYYFDIQDACQEWLNWYLIFAPNVFGTYVPNVTTEPSTYAQVQCRFRGSVQDPYGIITPDGPIPVQATADTPAIAGGGMFAIGCVVIDAALQHEEYPELRNHVALQRILQLRFTPGLYLNVNPLFSVYPMSHTKKLEVTMNDWGHWPGYVTELGYNGLPIINVKLMVLAYSEFGTGFVVGAYDMGYPFAVNHVSMFLLPYGPRALSSMPGYSAVPWQNVKQYYVYMRATSGPLAGNLVFSTPRIDICRCARRYRFWWRNYLGHFEQINFEEYSQVTETKSSMTEKPLVGRITAKRQYGQQRVNVSSNERTVLYKCFEEDQMAVVAEFLSSNQVYRELPRAEMDNYLTADFLPVLIKDGAIEKIKRNERWVYEVTIEMYNANDNIIPRN